MELPEPIWKHIKEYLFGFYFVEYYDTDNGKIKCKGFKTFDDRKHGHCIEYFDNGKLHKDFHYRYGKKHGQCIEYWDNCKPHEECHYRYGLMHGVCIDYTYEGKFQSIYNYNDGERHGACIDYTYYDPNDVYPDQEITIYEGGILIYRFDISGEPDTW